MNAVEWIAAYEQAWVGRDPEAAVELFTEDAVYRSHPFREPHTGSNGVREYRAGATSTQEELDLRFGEPVVEGTRSSSSGGRSCATRAAGSRCPVPCFFVSRVTGAPRSFANTGTSRKVGTSLLPAGAGSTGLP